MDFHNDDELLTLLRTWAACSGGVGAANNYDAIANYLENQFQRLDTYRVAFLEWTTKTDWVQEQGDGFPFRTLGLHRADIMRQEIERLRKLVAAQPKPRTDAEIVEQTEQLAAALAKADGYTSTVPYRTSTFSRAQHYWQFACLAQEMLTATDVTNAVANLEEPAPNERTSDAAILQRAINFIDSGSHSQIARDTMKNELRKLLNKESK